MVPHPSPMIVYLNVENYAFTFLFSYINLWGIIPGLTQGVGQGKGKFNPMWTQWRNVDLGGRNYGWVYNEWKGINIYR